MSAVFSCTDDKEYLPVSYVYLDLNLTYRDKKLRDILGYKTYITPGKDYVAGKEYAGYGGILVIHTITAGLCAFDLACPDEANPNIKVAVDDSDGLYAVCPQCGKKYEIGESGSGYATNTKHRLKKYNVIAGVNNRWVVTSNR
jgi:hypothetical protein